DEDFAWDADLEGFGLRLRRRVNGGLLRTWVVQYRSGGRQRRETLGPIEKLNPKHARAAAQKIFAPVTLGHAPQGEKEAQRREATRTLRVVVADYLAAKEAELRPVSLRIAKLYLTGPYFKALRPLAVSAIKRSDIASCIRTIGRNHSTATAAAARRAVSAFFACASPRGSWATALTRLTARTGPTTPSRAIACSTSASWPRSGSSAGMTNLGASPNC